MAKGYGKGMPQGLNMNNLVKQAQKMQQQMEKAQQELAEKSLEVTSGGGAVKVVVTADKQIKAISIKPEVADPDDIEMLEDLVLTAVNEALRQADEYASAEMTKITGGAGLPGGLF